MNISKFTQKSVQAVQDLEKVAYQFGNQEIEEEHLLYALLEQKAGLQETEFRLGFGQFIRCVCRLNGIPIKDDTIVQTWTRTSVQNDQELSQIATQSKGIVSDETIVAHHPWVDDPEKEMELLQKQEDAGAAEISEMFPKNEPGDGNDGQGGDE